MPNQAIQKVEKPWGYELIWAKSDQYVGKILHILKGQKLSLQYHRVKEESIFLSKGQMCLMIENELGQIEEKILLPGEAYHIAVGRKHRMIAIEDCDVFEVSTPQLDDIVRLEDSYGRLK